MKDTVLVITLVGLLVWVAYLHHHFNVEINSMDQTIQSLTLLLSKGEKI